ncbi:hypothetical protein [Streptomyces kronopolitis]|uniref:hypothetical protein n=1 Tax=Streptomyces kronopolitis TaxID=1612435 RepID=UPI0036AAEA01
MDRNGTTNEEITAPQPPAPPPVSLPLSPEEFRAIAADARHDAATHLAAQIIAGRPQQSEA